MFLKIISLSAVKSTCYLSVLFYSISDHQIPSNLSSLQREVLHNITRLYPCEGFYALLVEAAVIGWEADVTSTFTQLSGYWDTSGRVCMYASVIWYSGWRVPAGAPQAVTYYHTVTVSYCRLMTVLGVYTLRGTEQYLPDHTDKLLQRVRQN